MIAVIRQYLGLSRTRNLYFSARDSNPCTPRGPAVHYGVDNIRACLSAADRLGVRLEGVTARDLREGSLKAILALFFSLSKHKQQLKLQAEQTKQRKHDEMLSR
ncbi:unnamed protein product [Nezara viridula]|uniref:Calponin-homology (CH) domain-containing protein n=1 Tax=Nezara viridula TaxID=85310 RepID=A0A9P0HF59_NEZVI|nr:unnamed protein product [Nezara viridula]